MRTRLLFSLVTTVVVALGVLGYNLAVGNSPILGIDLQGGASVILEPVEDASSDDLTVIRDQVRGELERLGIAEPDVRVQGSTIVVDLPGIDDPQEAVDQVAVSGVVELRPILIEGCEELTVPDDPDVEAPDPSTATVPGAELLPGIEGEIYCAGPAQGTGEVFERGSADVQLDPTEGYFVVAGLRDETTWNVLAGQCFGRAVTCPTGQLGIVLDSVVQSAPVVQQPTFADEVSITGDFSQGEAEELARVINRGAFPVEVEPQEVETISPAAGSQSLRAAIIAGLIGVALVVTFLLLYYRWFALIVLGGLLIWGATVYSIASFVSEWTNYTLSLAGVTGIIVAVGVTVDSYVVFFERMKDEVRNGRTLKNAGPRSFAATWRTIWTADLVSVIGAAILFWLSVGSVRGFALFLGITTLCDLLVCYFFTRPAVILLARSRFMVGKRAFGLEVAQ